jgi:hypothetical protein
MFLMTKRKKFGQVINLLKSSAEEKVKTFRKLLKAKRRN